MKPSDITLDTPFGDVAVAIGHGEFTHSEMVAKLPRLQSAAAARQVNERIALNAVRDDVMGHKGEWRAKPLSREGVFKVRCGPNEWYVQVCYGEVSYLQTR